MHKNNKASHRETSSTTRTSIIQFPILLLLAAEELSLNLNQDNKLMRKRRSSGYSQHRTGSNLSRTFRESLKGIRINKTQMFTLNTIYLRPSSKTTTTQKSRF